MSSHVLCSDKTGTITKNERSLAAARSFDPYQEDELLRFAAMASDDATQDPIDVAIRSAAQAPYCTRIDVFAELYGDQITAG